MQHYMSVQKPETLPFLLHHQSEIRATWLDLLKKEWGNEKDSRVALLEQEQKGEKDLLSALIHQISGNKGDEKKCRDGILDRVRGEHYSVEDFLMETESLESSVEDVLRQSGDGTDNQTFEVTHDVRKMLKSLLHSTVHESLGIYEQIVESGARGFCLFKADGVIVSANDKMKSFLGNPSPEGKRLESFFDHRDRRYLRKMFSSAKTGKPQMHQMTLHSETNKKIPVWVEIATVTFPEGEEGGYLCAFNRSMPAKLEKRIFENLPISITKQTNDGEFTYMNKKACDTLGLENWEEKTLKDILPDEENYTRVYGHLKKRVEDLSDEYEVEVTRPVDQRKIPVRITAGPEENPQGDIIGSVAIIQDLTLDKASEKIRSFITTGTDTKQMLDNVVKEILPILPIDRFIITLYNSKMTHLRTFYSHDPHARTGQMESKIMWWPIPDAMKEMAQHTEPYWLGNIEEFLNAPERRHLKAQPEFTQLLQEGFQSSLRHAVVQQGKVVAGINLLSKKSKAYGEEERKLFDKLPLNKAVLMALHHEEMNNMKFRLNLIQKILSDCHNFHDVAETVIEELAAKYQWAHIALFKVDESRKQFTLFRQKVWPGAPCLQEPFALPFGKNILSRAYSRRERVNIADSRETPDYIPSVPNMLSELCLPIMIQGKVAWILNIEDRHQNAFSDEESKDIGDIVSEISAPLERLWLNHFLQTIQNSTSDLIFVTNRLGKIDQCNLQTLKQLDYTREELLSLNIHKIFADPEQTQDVIQSEFYGSRELKLRRKNGTLLPVLLSASSLTEDFEGKVFVCKDMSIFERVKELEYLKTMYNEIAVQTQIPLSLAFSWIRRVKEKTIDTDMFQTIDKALKQLSKVEITYNRLALYDKKEGILPYQEVLLVITEVIDYVLSELPESDRNRINEKREDRLPYIHGDLLQLTFCFEAIFSFLFRHLPPDNNINLQISSGQGWVLTEIEGIGPDQGDQRDIKGEKQVAISKTIMQMALADEIIKKFIHDHHRGEYSMEYGQGPRVLFKIRLPIAREQEV